MWLTDCRDWAVAKGIGVFFYTRKGQFLYKISSYIITYHVAIIIYHCVSSSVSWYIMSLVDTWYQWYTWYLNHDMISHDISCSFWQHDTNMILNDTKTWYRTTNIMSRIMARLYHVLVSMIYGHDTGVASPGLWDWTNNFYLYFISWYHFVSTGIMSYHVISRRISLYHVISPDIKRVRLTDLCVRGSLIS